MRTLIVAILGLFLLAGCKKEDEWGPECTKLESCCGSNATCQKLAEDESETGCKTAQATYCVDSGAAKPEAGGAEAGSPEASTPQCTKLKGENCGNEYGCCQSPYSCGALDSADQRKCCISVGTACDAPEDCCQLKQSNPNTCEGSKCCAMEGKDCIAASECCASAPNCTAGKCAQ